MKHSKLLLLTFSLLVLAGCTDPKGGQRQEHEDAKVWTPTHTPEDSEVKAQEFSTFDLAAAYQSLKDTKSDLTESVLRPLSQIVLNAKFIESAKYRNARLSEMISLFNTVFVIEFNKSPRSAKFNDLKNDYYNTVFAGCSRDLRTDCINAVVFSSDARHTHVMALLAGELDSGIEVELKAAGSPDICINAHMPKYLGKVTYANDQTCRNLVEERYRRLAMGVRKRSQFQDKDYSFAYLKYARLFAIYLAWAKDQPSTTNDRHASMSQSYLAEVHSQIFETTISKYTPENINAPEFHTFVENFKPWGFSRKNSDLFQYGTGVMFDLATKCCLYVDAAKTQMSPSLGQAIADSQKDVDAFGPSFVQMIDDIKKDHQDHLFKNLGLVELVAKIEQSRVALRDPSKPLPAGTFFNEYFYIVDRLFRGHLSTDEIGMVLRNSNSARARVELPAMISNYVKIYLVYMVMETNRFMATIYSSDIASDKIFEEALTRSREISGKWYNIQAQAELLDKLMSSYFRNLLISPPEYRATDDMLKALNRNIHYFAAYPQKIVMTYFLSKMKGTVTVRTWFGTVEVDADKILKEFFDGGVRSPWFRFGKDPEALDRLMLLYSLEYMLSTEGLKAFVAKDEVNVAGSERSKFFDLIFTKYVGDNIDVLRKAVADFKRNTVSNAGFAMAKAICAYETGAGGLPPRVTINFLDLHNYTYTGLGDNSINKVLVAFLTGARATADSLLGSIESRKTYVKVMLDVIEGDLLRTRAIANKGDSHPDLDKTRAILAELDKLQFDFTQMFLTNHKSYFDCALTLREIERRRANRLYDEERAHLEKIYDQMKTLAAITDAAALDAKVRDLNQTLFRTTQPDGTTYKFDQFDGLNYRMSQYDLLMRMKKRVESDIFTQVTGKEARAYGAELALSQRPRGVTVYVPESIVRETMYAEGTAKSIIFKGTSAKDREDFVNDGLNALNGSTQAYTQWRAQMQSDLTFTNYLSTLESMYLLQPTGLETADSATLSAEELVNAYVRFTATSTMDDYDMEYAKVFSSYGRYEKDFFQGRWFEKDGMNRLPLFYALMNDVFRLANISIDGGSVVSEALQFAKQFNSLQAFVFKPAVIQGTETHVVAGSVNDHYGKRIHHRLKRVGDLYSYIQTKESQSADAGALSQALKRPFYLEGDTFYSWYQPGVKNMVDVQRTRDHRILVNDLIQRSGNFYGTREKVGVQ